MEKISIPKRFIEISLAVLKETKLPFQQARQRDRVITQLIGQAKLFNDDRNKIAQEFCAKDEQGRPKVENDNYVFDTDESKQACIKEINILLGETIDINVDDINSLKTIMNNTLYEPKVGEAEFIEKLLEYVKKPNPKAKKSSAGNGEESA